MKIICTVGTRPEAIKMAPVILELKKQPWAQVRVLATAQHREMLDQVMAFFDITPDIDLNIMKPNQNLTELTARLLLELDKVLVDEQPDVVLAQGDTTTVFAMALACFYKRIPFGHVEQACVHGICRTPSRKKPIGCWQAGLLAGTSRQHRVRVTTCCAKVFLRKIYT